MSSAARGYVANCSLLFTEHPLLARPACARAAGFTEIEFWWPFPAAVPSDKEVTEFVDAVRGAGVALVGLNYFAGDLAGPDCGVLSIPGREAEFRDSVEVASGIGRELGVSVFNALYGNRVEDATALQQDELGADNLAFAAAAAAEIGATVLVEAVSGPKPYPLRTAADVLTVLWRVRSSGHVNLGFLLDIYHLATNGEDVAKVIDEHVADIAHVQIADAPGRGEPGSGSLDLAGLLTRLRAAGYGGRVALEYRPTTAGTEDSLGALPELHRASSRHHSDQGDPT